MCVCFLCVCRERDTDRETQRGRNGHTERRERNKRVWANEKSKWHNVNNGRIWVNIIYVFSELFLFVQIFFSVNLKLIPNEKLRKYTMLYFLSSVI